ncbi:MAG: hemolysin III family protein [Planctomyces sp.]|nr:hemolysin III family protein [Planctomyces sp.]
MQTSIILVESPSAQRWAPETLNQWTHGFGAILSVIGAGVMLSTVLPTGDAWRIAGCAIYVASLVALYVASTLSHSFECGPRRDFYRMLDQVCIFLLVVGTYTPFGMVHHRENGWWMLLVAMWLLATMGIVERVRRGTQGTPFRTFVMLGWLPIIGFGRIHEVCQGPGLALVVAGGLSYLGGLWFLCNDVRRPYYHAAWHLSTIAGSTCHFLFLLEYVARVPAA